MTSSQIPSPIAMPCPFAGDGATLGTIDTTSTNNMNYPKGFPTVYGAPTSASGKFVSRGEMNRLGNIATVAGFRNQCGAINTFDADFAEAIDGYPKGIVLDLVKNGKLFKVESLKDNNNVDFRTLVDNINWRYLNYDTSDSDKNVIQKYSVSMAGCIVLGTFKSSQNFILSTSLPSIEKETSVQIASGGYHLTGYIGAGVSIAVRDLGTTGTLQNINFPTVTITTTTTSSTPSVNWNSWQCIGGDFRFYTWYNSGGTGSATTQTWVQQTFWMSPTVVSLTANHYYAVAMISNGYTDCSATYDGESAATVSGKTIKLSGDVEIYATTT